MQSKLVFWLRLLLIGGVVLTFCVIPAFTENESGKILSPKPTAAVSPEASSSLPRWRIQPGFLSNLRIYTPQKQIFFVDGCLNLAMLEKGKIQIYQNNNETPWEQLQTLEVSEVKFTTFIISDLNHDSIPEIVAGTTDPGFIYIYKWDSGQWQWVTHGNPKYIWSAIAKLTTLKLGNFNIPTKSGTVKTSKGNDNIETYLLVQNKEGFLLTFKVTDTTIDLTWKSPSAWKPLAAVLPFNLDQDSNDELIAVYQNGGIEILKNVRNAVTPVWKYFPWGKVLEVKYDNWDNDNTPELILTTTQKMISLIKPAHGKFIASQQMFNYVIEKMYFTNVANRRFLFTADTTGKVHLLEQPAKSSAWKEIESFKTGRILEFVPVSPNKLLVVNQLLQTFELQYAKNTPEHEKDLFSE
ncbi:MAG TPA: hypothetical protein VIM29_12120 [Bacillota bacterium]